MKGVFTISLDFELHWGGFEKWPLEERKDYFLRTREVIPRLLDLFNKYQIHTTWATVGLLFFDHRKALERALPSVRPTYENSNLSAYRFIKEGNLGSNESDDPYHFALSLIRKIKATPNQEVGSHTFAHFYCNEPGQTLDQFRQDLKAARSAAGDLGIELRSLVFPRNQFNAEYLKACYEEGIRAVRDNPDDWFWKIESTENESWWKRFNRGLNAYVDSGSRTSYPLSSVQVESNMPVCLKASRLLRPYRPQEKAITGMKVTRIQRELIRAAKAGEVYHLWWHPHNFGSHPRENLRELERILATVIRCHDLYGMRCLTMGETAQEILQPSNEEATVA